MRGDVLVVVKSSDKDQKHTWQEEQNFEQLMRLFASHIYFIYASLLLVCQ